MPLGIKPPEPVPPPEVRTHSVGISARDSILRSPQKFEPFVAFDAQLSIRVISGRERDLISAMYADGAPQAHRHDRLAALFLGDENGKRVFEDTDKDIEIISGMDNLELQRIVTAGLKLNRLSKESDDEKKA